jgi:tRNA nucleotidyltransferase (CCA-adding enzyme)
MENHVYIVARSRLKEVDAGEVAMAFGGGGHASAASASVKGQTLIQVENHLFDILPKVINPHRLARDLMSAPVIQVDPMVTMKEANEKLTRYNVNVLVVMESGAPVGLISRQVIEKGIHHKLDHIPVREYMTTEIGIVSPDATLSEIQEKIIENKQRILPVMKDGKIKGVITRTNLLNILVDQDSRKEGKIRDPILEPQTARTRNVRKLMKERLKKNLIDMLKSIGETATELGYNSYVVGGFVRDLFLYRKNEDIDIVIEGDGIAFAKKFAKIAGARINAY